MSEEGYNTADEDEKLTEYSWDDINKHTEFDENDSSKRIWMVIHGRIYDITEFMMDHPGGEDVLKDVSGKDATQEFENILHTEKARKMCKKYLIGKVKDMELTDLFEETSKSSYNNNNSQSSIPTLIVLALFIAIIAFLFKDSLFTNNENTVNNTINDDISNTANTDQMQQSQ